MIRTSAFVLPLAALLASAACAGGEGKGSAQAANGSAGASAASGGTTAAAATASGPATGATGEASTATAQFDGATPDSAAISSFKGKLGSTRGPHDQQSFDAAVRAGMRAQARWPKGPAYTNALLPANRIVAFYGNPRSKRMGILGEIEPQAMLARLERTVAEWRKADQSRPVIPALHLVSVVAQGAPGRDGMYRLRMDSSLIEQVYGWAKQKDALLFVDIQVGHSTVQAELPGLMRFLERPDVHLGLDPEFSMHHDKEGIKPSVKIGTMRAAEINWAIQQLSELVKRKNLPPKILVVHRFTRLMVPDAENIRPTPQVQVVMDMDGWGPPWLKFDSYHHYIVRFPVQYTGFKIFFGNDTRKGGTILTPSEVLQLRPAPLYIQYQ